MKMKRIETDVLVLGSGGAGPRAAIEARRYGVNVLLADKSLIGLNNNTRFSGGGFRAASQGGCGVPFLVSSYDSPLEHFKDTLRVGEFLNDQQLAEVLCFEAPARVLELMDFGLKDLSEIMLHSSYPHGTLIVKPLLETIERMGVRTYRRLCTFDLLCDDGTIVGALAFDLDTAEFVTVRAKSVVLATGGAGEVYERDEDAITATGNGHAMAYRAGAKLVDMEMVHFEPYVHAEPDLPMMDRHESAAGVYGILRNRLGEDFLPNYIPRIGPPGSPFHEQFGAFNPDIRCHVSRAMAQEVYEGRGDGGAVLYDLTHVSEDIWQSDVASQYLRKVLARGHDVRKTPIHVFPAVITTLGGIRINEDCETNLPGLYAAGEVAGGTHGAMRMGGNALSETIVFGARAGRSAAKRALSLPMAEVDIKRIEERVAKAAGEILRRSPSEEGHPEVIKRRIKSIMWGHCGPLRTREGLEEAIRGLERIRRENLPKVFANSMLKLRSALESVDMLVVAQMIARSALYRTESRGGHYRLDFPTKDEKWLRNITITRRDGEMELSTQPVAMTRFQPHELPSDSPLARVLEGIERLRGR
jgi:fumarate reductase (CoM/CoB) subunit A